MALVFYEHSTAQTDWIRMLRWHNNQEWNLIISASVAFCVVNKNMLPMVVDGWLVLKQRQYVKVLIAITMKMSILAGVFQFMMIDWKHWRFNNQSLLGFDWFSFSALLPTHFKPKFSCVCVCASMKSIVHHPECFNGLICLLFLFVIRLVDALPLLIYPKSMIQRFFPLLFVCVCVVGFDTC